MALAPGTRLGPYEILAPLGAGGMGEVYRARDSKLDRDVAIKVLPQSLAADPAALARFEREAKAVAALSHPNILAIHDFGTHEGISYAVMELLEGETLRGKLDAGPVPRKQAVDYALQIVKGLSAAHEKGVVHRDLKPENVFVQKDGHVKILDFGLAKREAPVAPGEETSAPTASQHTRPGTVMGTVGYMSPEQVRGLPVDHRSDLFSFGTILYEVLSGRRAFRKNTASDTLAAILREEPRDFGDRTLPGKLKSMIRKLLEKDPTKRYASAEQVHAELRAVEASWEPTRPALSRSAGIAVAALVVAAAASAVWLWHRASRARWALETAAPEIARLVDAREFAKAAALTRAARAVLPKDPTLNKLWGQVTREVSVNSDPPGADVSVRLFRGDPEAWESLGQTPLQKIRVAVGAIYVWRIAKPGFASAYQLWQQKPVVRLIPEKSVPPGMIAVPGGDVELESAALDYLPAVPLADYLIDRNEVTNEEYRRFVDEGGYQNRKLWKQPFVMNGRTISFEEATARFLDSTGRPGPATWEVGNYSNGLQKHPVAGVSWYEAAAYAEFAGKSLPTIYHWNHAAQVSASMMIVPGSNFSGAGTDPVGSPGSLSGFGTTDMAGNVKEWCWNESRGGERFILGGGFGEAVYMFWSEDAQSPWDRQPNYGFRCVKLPSPAPPVASASVEKPAFRDFWKAKPMSDEVFKALKGPYAYDQGELNARTEETETTEGWTREKVSFNAAYGGERMIAYLYLPRHAAPPLQTVVLFPGDWAITADKYAGLDSGTWDFVSKSGRAVMIPVYKGTYERRDALKSDYPDSTAFYRDHMIMWSKDLGRSIDYLETRKDVDHTRIAYFGVSWGALVAPILLAVDERFKAAILQGGGLMAEERFKPLPAADPINFVPHVKVSVLMVNGRYDYFFPVELSQLPLFRLLGTAEKDKRHIIYEVGHNIGGRAYIRPILDWLDKYLGPVKR